MTKKRFVGDACEEPGGLKQPHNRIYCQSGDRQIFVCLFVNADVHRWGEYMNELSSWISSQVQRETTLPLRQKIVKINYDYGSKMLPVSGGWSGFPSSLADKKYFQLLLQI